MQKRILMQKKLGVIGGLGTDTAAQFYVESERFWHDLGEKNHIPLMLENVQSSFSLEQSLTRTMSRAEELRSFLCLAAKNLEKGGATLVVLPCNTAHVHIDSVRSAIQVPMLSITEEIAKKLRKNHAKTTAILGTRITKESRIYDEECRKQGIETLYPEKTDQLVIERIIQRALSWKNNDEDTQSLTAVISRVKKAGADSVVLACTDLQLCMPQQPIEGVFDSMKTLAEASVRELMIQLL